MSPYITAKYGQQIAGVQEVSKDRPLQVQVLIMSAASMRDVLDWVEDYRAGHPACTGKVQVQQALQAT
jgi:hypothetical protein